jgi:hypothetical protein
MAIALGHTALDDDLPPHPNVTADLGLRPAPDDFHGEKTSARGINLLHEAFTSSFMDLVLAPPSRQEANVQVKF